MSYEWLNTVRWSTIANLEKYIMEGRHVDLNTVHGNGCWSILHYCGWWDWDFKKQTPDVEEVDRICDGAGKVALLLLQGKSVDTRS